MDAILPLAAEQFSPDSIVCTGDTPVGRPSPFMIYRSLMDMGVWPASACFKVERHRGGDRRRPECRRMDGRRGDERQCVRVVDGRHGARLPAAELASRRDSGHARLRVAGAHYVIDSVADLLPVAVDIEGRLQRGERP